MRRIYESEALRRDDRDPFVPSESDEGERSRSAIDWHAASHALMPVALRERAIAVGIETDRSVYDVGETVAVRVTLRNRIPFPVALRTRSPVLWRWFVDDVPEASRVEEHDPADRRGILRFDRSERKTFRRRWTQQIRESRREWRAVEPGEYTLRATVDVDDAAERGLSAETTIEVR